MKTGGYLEFQQSKFNPTQCEMKVINSFIES